MAIKVNGKMWRASKPTKRAQANRILRKPNRLRAELLSRPRTDPIRRVVVGTLIPSPAAALQNVTGVAATNVLTVATHPLPDGAAVVFSGLTGGAGLSNGTVYFVRDSAGLTFKVAANPNGPAIDFSTNVTAGQVRFA